MPTTDGYDGRQISPAWIDRLGVLNLVAYSREVAAENRARAPRARPVRSELSVPIFPRGVDEI